MRDDKGLFYYPFPENKRVRMYVKSEDDMIWFRMWNRDDEKLWEQHDWVPWGAIKKAMGMYKVKDFDPHKAYDIEVAKLILKEGE